MEPHLLELGLQSLRSVWEGGDDEDPSPFGRENLDSLKLSKTLKPSARKGQRAKHPGQEGQGRPRPKRHGRRGRGVPRDAPHHTSWQCAAWCCVSSRLRLLPTPPEDDARPPHTLRVGPASCASTAPSSPASTWQCDYAGSVGWYYLSNATCLIRPHFFSSTALLV